MNMTYVCYEYRMFENTRRYTHRGRDMKYQND